ncbi:MAG: hypothetical protein SFU99_02915 [Saprospiraceae bacterium]|nr:hypothetical protein [Saprospiraceae bacterium]
MLHRLSFIVLLLLAFQISCTKDQLQDQEISDDIISDIVDYWSLQISLLEEHLEENNVLNLSFVLSKKKEVKDFTFDVELIEKGNAVVSPRACVDSKGGEWDSCKTFNNKIQAQLWLAKVIKDCKCNCFETRTEYGSGGSFEIFFRQCQL